MPGAKGPDDVSAFAAVQAGIEAIDRAIEDERASWCVRGRKKAAGGGPFDNEGRVVFSESPTWARGTPCEILNSRMEEIVDLVA
jgi:hypothetical protein